jgi:hypothetical protein
MRLLNTQTLELTSFIGEVPEYVILSHRWDEGEILFEDVLGEPLNSDNNPAKTKRGFTKVLGTCKLAASDGFQWVWIDSCCIDKSSSAELQEAINSMFKWYQEAQICYAYLSDVPDEPSGWSKAFDQSQWFTRGWTLQELLAPCNVEFYSADWSPIGTKLCRAETVALITGIETAALEHGWMSGVDKFCAAQKLSWAAHRLVSKAEDKAYCLFGLFNVNMPLLYGEGELKAFRRLQLAIYEESADHTLFLYTRSRSLHYAPLLAPSTEAFCRNENCRQCVYGKQCFPLDISYSEIVPNQALWPGHLQDAYYIRLLRESVMVQMPLLCCDNLFERGKITFALPHGPDTYIAVLPLSRRGYETHLFGIILKRVSHAEFVRVPLVPRQLHPQTFDMEGEARAVFTVHNFGYARGSRLRSNFVLFEFHSQTLKLASWHTQTEDYCATTWANAPAFFPIPRQEKNHFSVTVCFENVSDTDLAGRIVLGNCVGQMGLGKISFDEELRLWDSLPFEPSIEGRRCMRRTVPIPDTEDVLNVALRRLPVFESGSLSMQPSGSHTQRKSPFYSNDPDHELLYRYRIDINRSSKESPASALQPRQLEETIQDLQIT